MQLKLVSWNWGVWIVVRNGGLSRTLWGIRRNKEIYQSLNFKNAPRHIPQEYDLTYLPFPFPLRWSFWSPESAPLVLLLFFISPSSFIWYPLLYLFSSLFSIFCFVSLLKPFSPLTWWKKTPFILLWASSLSMSQEFQVHRETCTNGPKGIGGAPLEPSLPREQYGWYKGWKKLL